LIVTKEIYFLSFTIFPNFPDVQTPMMVLHVIGGIQSGCWTANKKEANFVFALIQVFRNEQLDVEQF